MRETARRKRAAGIESPKNELPKSGLPKSGLKNELPKNGLKASQKAD